MFRIKFVKMQDILSPLHIFVTSLWTTFRQQYIISADMLDIRIFLLFDISIGISPQNVYYLIWIVKILIFCMWHVGYYLYIFVIYKQCLWQLGWMCITVNWKVIYRSHLGLRKNCDEHFSLFLETQRLIEKNNNSWLIHNENNRYLLAYYWRFSIDAWKNWTLHILQLS